MKILALCAFRNAHDLLPEFLDHLKGHVDGTIMYDDCSQDGGLGICEDHDVVTMTIEDTSGKLHPPHSTEVENRWFLLKEAMKQDADWILALDVDMRCEKKFLTALPHLIEQEPQSIYSIRLRDLWGSMDQYRTDGPWAWKRLLALFPCPREDDMTHYYQPGTLHQPWVPPQMGFRLPVTELDYSIYHLGSLTPEMRAARVAKFNAIDGQHKFQADYNYLADEAGLQLEQIPAGRGWK